MTNSESILQFGNNSYGKPATALNILRETILGRELFDFAFKKYAERWAFKHPMPADLFRTLEDATGIDLDWFWRGWFYTTDHVDLAISNVDWYRVNTRDPRADAEFRRMMDADHRRNLTIIRNLEEISEVIVEKYPELRDKYTDQDPYEVTQVDLEKFEEYMEGLDDEMRSTITADKHFYEITLENIGGLVMPVILEFTFQDGTTQQMRIPAELWRQHNKFAHKVFIFDKPLRQVRLDPNLETADTDIENNFFPRRFTPKRFQVR